MTSLTFHFSRAIGRYLAPGDEIVITRLDHDANIAPWAALAENGIVIKRVDFDPLDCRLNLEQFKSLITDKTRLVAVGYASNAVGTINPVQQIAALTHKVGAWLWVDAVHYAPHGPIDVQAIDCDFLVVSAYKFFGPHVGVLWGRLNILEKLDAYRVRPADPQPPGKFETGTLNHEGLAGISAAIDYLADLGRQYGPALDQEKTAAIACFEGRRKDLKSAMMLIREYERLCFGYLLQEIQKIPGISVYGITEPKNLGKRCPTLAFRKQGITPKDIALALSGQGIFVWDGNYFAISVTEQLGLEETGGMVRVGIAHYNTKQEVDRFLSAMKNIT
jgi:cysteine desulfurase family protein (TIGR01976 family)